MTGYKKTFGFFFIIFSSGLAVWYPLRLLILG